MPNAIAISKPSGLIARVPFYYGWVIMGAAALAMVATLPGRTQGLGLITESLLKDLQIDRVTFAQMNLWATLIGSLFCIGFGRLIDRFGSRVILAGLSLALGGVVLAMSRATGIAPLFFLLALARGFGQSALSVVSQSMVGQWFRQRLNKAMGIYTVVLSIGFMAAFPIVGSVVLSDGWRTAWAGIGWSIAIGLTLVAILFVRRDPESCGVLLENKVPANANSETEKTTHSFTWSEALRTPAFWVVALASSVYGLVASGIGLFNESVLAELGFDASIYHQTLIVTAMTSLIGNFLAGWLSTKWKMNRIMAIAMGLLAVALLGLPKLSTLPQVYLFASVMGIAGGFVIVVFFSFWANVYGRAHLGRILGTAQMLTVLASAIGPLLLAKCHEWTNSYTAVFQVLTVVVVLFAIAAWVVKLPQAKAA